MTWEEKFEALKALSPTEINMRRPGDWYCSVRAELKRDCFLEGISGNGCSPAAAVESAWLRCTELNPKYECLVVGGMSPDRRHYRWNGYRWEERPIAKE